jgi:DNA-directed RNA polymerase I, II, and III subunit RPABC2
VRCCSQPFNEGEEEDAGHEAGHPVEGGEERMEVLDGAQPPQQPSNAPRITTRYMTKYERARILGTRALQIRCRRRPSAGP